MAKAEHYAFWRESVLPRGPQPTHPCRRMCSFCLLSRRTGHGHGTRSLGHPSGNCSSEWPAQAEKGSAEALSDPLPQPPYPPPQRGPLAARSSVAATMPPSVHLAQGTPPLVHLAIKQRSFSHTACRVLWSSAHCHQRTEGRGLREKRNAISFLPSECARQACAVGIKHNTALCLFLRMVQMPPGCPQDPLPSSHSSPPFARRKREVGPEWLVRGQFLLRLLEQGCKSWFPEGALLS